MKLGFIGLGIMGTPMAGHLRAAGHELFVATRSNVPQVLLDAGAVKRVQLHYAVMSNGYMVVVDGKTLETSKRETREFKTLDAAARCLFKLGLAEFAVKLRTA